MVEILCKSVQAAEYWEHEDRWPGDGRDSGCAWYRITLRLEQDQLEMRRSSSVNTMVHANGPLFSRDISCLKDQGDIATIVVKFSGFQLDFHVKGGIVTHITQPGDHYCDMPKESLRQYVAVNAESRRKAKEKEKAHSLRIAEHLRIAEERKKKLDQEAAALRQKEEALELRWQEEQAAAAAAAAAEKKAAMAAAKATAAIEASLVAEAADDARAKDMFVPKVDDDVMYVGEDRQSSGKVLSHGAVGKVLSLSIDSDGHLLVEVRFKAGLGRVKCSIHDVTQQ
eukprot:TRINITY_DN32311_c0_g1_i1.p1 TRINITY_DN32311_c0_g1~~TRINITY_DN32311_c0_g1_i1.p1  ORF type:complete len:283 (+),score=63.42 TRINITY_DN32311_c0_g1_i1:138-986(+)